MSIEDDLHAVARPTADSAYATSLLGYRARDRMAELLEEARQERLARLAREARRSGPQESGSAPPHALLSAAMSALAALARRVAIPRPRRGTS